MRAQHYVLMASFSLYRPKRPLGLRQRGSALAEFSIVAMALLCLGLILPEAAHWHTTRQVLHLALMEAARAGATDHGRPAQIARAFEIGLLPLHVTAQGPQAAQQKLRRKQEKLRARTGLLPWRIEVLSPDAQAFRGHTSPSLVVPGARGLRAINNHYQRLQHENAITPAATSIFEANTLSLRLTYLHEPLIPMWRVLLKSLGKSGPNYVEQAFARGTLPIRVRLDMDMQSHPVDWGARGVSPNGHIVYGACEHIQC